MLLEVDLSELDPRDFRERLLQHGTVLIRNAISAEALGPVSLSIAAMLDHYDQIPEDVILRETEFEVPYKKEEWREILVDGVHYNMDLVAFSQGRHSLFEPLRNSRLSSLVREAWPEMEVRENFISNIRRVFSREATGYGDAPLTSHVDAQFHQHELLGINFWTPLTDAGINEPGLAIVPMGVEDTRAFLEYNPEGYERTEHDFSFMHLFRTKKYENEELKARFVRPQMHPGDVLAFTNFTIHATSLQPHMTKSRTSIEMRVLLLDKPGS
jgi:hypothetical protein